VTVLPGEHTFELTVTDAAGATATDEVTLFVEADEPPEIVLADRSAWLWPPNHKAYPFSAEGLVEAVVDDCSEISRDAVYFARATSDEPDDGRGDGNTTDDVRFSADCSEAHVRAERAGGGDGRTYELFLQVEDGAGNVSEEARYRVRVVHDQAHDASKDRIAARYACRRKACASAPSECAEAASARVRMRVHSRGHSLYYRAAGFPEYAVSEDADQACLYVDGVKEGGAVDLDRVSVKKDKLKIYTRGDGLELPDLPLDEGAELRVEVHDGEGCVASSFSDPQDNDERSYKARSSE
jgi:hypothetical protein